MKNLSLTPDQAAKYIGRIFLAAFICGVVLIVIFANVQTV